MAMGMGMGMGAEPDADESGGMSDLDADDYEPKDEFEREAMDAFDDTKPMAERMIALKEAIRICAEKDYASEGSGGEEKKGSGLALIFGAPKKKG